MSLHQLLKESDGIMGEALAKVWTSKKQMVRGKDPQSGQKQLLHPLERDPKTGKGPDSRRSLYLPVHQYGKKRDEAGFSHAANAQDHIDRSWGHHTHAGANYNEAQKHSPKSDKYKWHMNRYRRHKDMSVNHFERAGHYLSKASGKEADELKSDYKGKMHELHKDWEKDPHIKAKEDLKAQIQAKNPELFGKDGKGDKWKAHPHLVAMHHALRFGRPHPTKLIKAVLGEKDEEK